MLDVFVGKKFYIQMPYALRSSLLSITVSFILINGPSIALLVLQIQVISIKNKLAQTTDYFMIKAFVTDPGIIPARLWGGILPAKYKSVDVNYTSFYIKCYHQESLIVMLVIIVYYDLIIIAFGLVLALAQETIVNMLYDYWDMTKDQIQEDEQFSIIFYKFLDDIALKDTLQVCVVFLGFLQLMLMTRGQLDKLQKMKQKYHVSFKADNVQMIKPQMNNPYIHSDYLGTNQSKQLKNLTILNVRRSMMSQGNADLNRSQSSDSDNISNQIRNNFKKYAINYDTNEEIDDNESTNIFDESPRKNSIKGPEIKIKQYKRSAEKNVTRASNKYSTAYNYKLMKN
ncbi:UNKNOWN [Stylonychia lemnae]|uniref:Transmembrane protein n=1 Tax=Stylonychia lemnae TaxID=5949 RepID=A0A078A817_STYLE|nr:UNKNOWN [Stylonychia lemnae]|eukprot:CDW78011.1 UNKNOWN [Stylonychia lemnae]